MCLGELNYDMFLIFVEEEKASEFMEYELTCVMKLGFN